MRGATVADFYEQLVIDSVPASNPENPARVSFHAATEIGSLRVEQVCNRFFSFSKIDLHFRYNTLIPANDNPKDKVGFYMLDYGRGGMAEFIGTSPSNSGCVSGGQCYIAFNPSLPEVHRFDAQSTKPLYMEITADYFASLLDNDDDFTGRLKARIHNREFFGMKTMLSPYHNRFASTIYDCPLEGSLGNLMMEGSLQQFVALQLGTFAHAPRVQSFTNRDKDTMHAIKEYLHKNFQQNHTLLDLSKHFGINQNKLKKSFKEIFGVSVIAYLYDLKMDHARTMLYDHGMHVGEVSNIVGYKNANHFATAFKRKFGMNPSKV